MCPGRIAVDVVIEAGVLTSQPLQHRFVRLGWGSLAHTTSVPFVWSCSRNRAWSPPTSSSLAEEERLRSLLLSTAVRDFPTLAADGARSPRSSLLKFPAGGSAAYDKAMATADGRRRVRWPLWLAAGVLFGLAIGFAFGLARPRVRN